MPSTLSNPDLTVSLVYFLDSIFPSLSVVRYAYVCEATFSKNILCKTMRN